MNIFSNIIELTQNRWLRRVALVLAILAIGSIIMTVAHTGPNTSDQMGYDFAAMSEMPADSPASAGMDAATNKMTLLSDKSVASRGYTSKSQAQNGSNGGARSVISKATIEIETPDVYGLTQKMRMLLNEARGEYIEESSISGDPKEHPRAEVRLRVASDRLSDVLNELRNLGHVISEKVTGDDVTNQIVDVDARLRNARRIETELLELMDKRKDSPLNEIIALRREINNVRSEIERLDAQQKNLNHLVSLATVLVIIRTAGEKPDDDTNMSIGSYFVKVLKKAWKNALLTIADSAAWALQFIVGGLIWWLIASAIVFTTIFLYRRTKSETTT